MQKFIGGIGCFWDETEYQGVLGIISTECGYCGGKNSKVTYEQVCGGDTEHIEVVKVIFDPNIISYENITWPTSYSLVIFIKTSISEKNRTLRIMHIPPRWF